MLKRLYILSLTLVLIIDFCFLTGCNIEKTSDKKIQDVKYEIIDDTELPYDVSNLYFESISENNRIYYSTKDTTYILICYGIMPYTGYTIDIDEFYETETNYIIDTTLIGPKTREQLVENESYPAIILKVAKKMEKPILFI